MNGKIRTYTGKLVNPMDMETEDIDIRDIAHGLSMICRFNGQCKRFYSVAEHSVHVASIVPEPYKFAALLHDASEAYLSDLNTFVKHSPELMEYRLIEGDLQDDILIKFCEISNYCRGYDHIKAADVLMYGKEKYSLFDGPFTEADIHPKRYWAAKIAKFPHRLELRCWRPKDAENAFMHCFYKYKPVELMVA